MVNIIPEWTTHGNINKLTHIETLTNQKTSAMCRTALITGSTSGIGLGIAHALAKRGYNILLSGFGDEQVIEQLVTDIKQ